MYIGQKPSCGIEETSGRRLSYEQFILPPLGVRVHKSSLGMLRLELEAPKDSTASAWGGGAAKRGAGAGFSHVNRRAPPIP